MFGYRLKPVPRATEHRARSVAEAPCVYVHLRPRVGLLACVSLVGQWATSCGAGIVDTFDLASPLENDESAREMALLGALIAQFHQYRPGGFAHRVGTEYADAEGGHTQAQSVFVAILVLYQ